MRGRIVLGMGDNVDYEIEWRPGVYEQLIAQYGIRGEELSADHFIETERDMVLSILGFVKDGRGGERFVANPEVIEAFAARFPKKTTLGGTGVRAAIAMAKFGYTASLHLVTVNDCIRSLLPPGCEYVCSNGWDNHYPHLIVQFPTGATVSAGDIRLKTARANRLIYNHNLDNMRMLLSERLEGFLREAKVFLISGFNAIHHGELLKERLDQLTRMMRVLPRDAVVYLEDGGYHEPALRKILQQALCPVTDIYAMNEDELQECLGRKVDLLNAKDVRQALGDVRALAPVPVIVVHAKYWALASGNVTAAVRQGLTGGVALATTRYRLGEDFNKDDCDATERLPMEDEGVRFSREIEALMPGEVCCVPSFHVDKANATTIGLGDAFVGGFLARYSNT